jgi:hypothetical protein
MKVIRIRSVSISLLIEIAVGVILLTADKVNIGVI